MPYALEWFDICTNCFLQFICCSRLKCLAVLASSLETNLGKKRMSRGKCNHYGWRLDLAKGSTWIFKLPYLSQHHPKKKAVGSVVPALFCRRRKNDIILSRALPARWTSKGIFNKTVGMQRYKNVTKSQHTNHSQPCAVVPKKNTEIWTT